MKYLFPLLITMAVTAEGFSQGRDKARQRPVDLGHLQQQFADSGLPAAYMIGVNLKSNKRIALAMNYSADGGDIFRIASMTKLVTTVAALQLVEQGKVGLDETLNERLPGMAKLPIIDKNQQARGSDAPISLRQLLTHTAGFAYGFSSRSLDDFLKKNAETVAPTAFLSLPRVGDPGKTYCYGTSLDWTGKLVEAISGKSLEQYLRDHVTGPLKMDSTWFNPPIELHERIVEYHIRSGDAFQVGGERVPAKSAFHSGGGGLVSSANDYLRLLTCLCENGELDGVRILKKQTVDTMFQDHLPQNLSVGFHDAPAKHDWVTDGGFDRDLRNDRWGLSWALEGAQPDGLRSPGTAFWAGIFNSYYTLDRQQGVIVLYYSQFLPFSDPDAYGLYRAFEKEVYAQTR